MKSYRKELWFNIPKRRAFLNITSEVEKCLRESGVKEGMALVNSMHITSSVFINDDESGLHGDTQKSPYCGPRAVDKDFSGRPTPQKIPLPLGREWVILRNGWRD